MPETYPSERWNHLRNRGLLLSLAAPMVVLPFAYDATELPKLTFLRLIALGLMLTGLFTVSRSAWASSKESEISEIHPLRLPIMLFLIVMGFAAFLSPDRWSSLAAFVDLAMLAFYAFAFTGAAREASFQARALRTLVAVGGTCAGWALLQRGLHDPLNGAAVRLSGGIPVGPFANPALLASFLAPALPLALGMTLAGQGRGRYLSGLCLALISAALGMAHLPLAMVGALIGGGIVIAAFRTSGANARVKISIFAASAALVCATYIAGRTPAVDTQAVAELRGVSVRMTQASPVLGWGPGAFGLVAPRYAHSDAGFASTPNLSPVPNPGNTYLSLLTAGGGLGFLAFLGIVVGIGVQLAKRLKGRSEVSDDVTVSDAEAEPLASDSALAAVWSGFLAAWLIGAAAAPQSIAMMAPFWCVAGLASTATRRETQAVPCSRWPLALRLAGALAILALAVPLPGMTFVQGLRHGIKPAFSLDSELASGPGAAVRWLVSDLYYAQAVRARDRRDWDSALSAHMNALKWAPSRMGNWMGYGETARLAVKGLKERPAFWVQYGKLGYYRAEKLQPTNGFFHYGEARLLSEAIERGGTSFYPEARKAYERAIALYPAMATFHSDYGRLLERMGESEAAISQYRAALSLGAARREDRVRLGTLLCKAGQPEEGQYHLRLARGGERSRNESRKG